MLSGVGPLIGGLSLRRKRLAAGSRRLGGHEREGNDAWLGTLVDPVVDRAALHEYVAGLQMYGGAVEIHVDFSRYDDGIIDRVSAMIARRDTWSETDNAEDGAIGDRGANLPS